MSSLLEVSKKDVAYGTHPRAELRPLPPEASSSAALLALLAAQNARSNMMFQRSQFS
jgi:hypothetical protein